VPRGAQETDQTIRVAVRVPLERGFDSARDALRVVPEVKPAAQLGEHVRGARFAFHDATPTLWTA
jgi:hypothetical protein